MTQEMLSPAVKIAAELKVKVSQIEAAIRLLDEGATVPFIARYRKEATAGLDDTQLRSLAERLHYLRDLDERRAVVLQTIREQEKLSPELEQAILAADTKTRLEDLYLPYRPKRRTKALIAEEAGLLPLSDSLIHDPTLDPIGAAAPFVNLEAGFGDVAAVLEGARQILIERFVCDAAVIHELRVYLWEHGVLKTRALTQEKKSSAHKYADYFDYAEPIKKIPSHRALALFRGRREQALQMALVLPENEDYCEHYLAQKFQIIDQGRLADPWLLETVRLAWKTRLAHKIESELFARLRELADDEAIHVFTRNLRNLLLAAPAGKEVTMGLDPGIRTGVKVAVIDGTGKYLNETTIFPFSPKNEWHEAIAELAKLAAKYHVRLISIGNGTGSRDTSRLVNELLKQYPDMTMTPVLVNEAGASVYSASESAAEEFPDLDVTLRGAVSIARRLQDPLAELVKIDPKAIGVGQYQHDVNQSRLERRLHDVVEDCVNHVGVNVNTASVALLTYVAGLNATLAKNIVAYRDEHGPFKDREQLKQVPRMGDKTFQQAAGFLRITEGTNPLDASGVHPESYPLVHKLLNVLGSTLHDVIQDAKRLHVLDAQQFVDDQYGLLTIRDVLQELEKPGRDPRPLFKTPVFQEGVLEISHLKEGMILEGVVSNVTNFGAFVDIGVHQDGLVHISVLTDRFVRDPHEVIKAGEIVKVKVMEVDLARKRIGLSMKDLEPLKNHQQPRSKSKPQAKPQAKTQIKPKSKPQVSPVSKAPFNTAMADALAKLKHASS